MAESLWEYYNETFTNSKPHCLLCFKTDAVLIRPKHLKLFLKQMFNSPAIFTQSVKANQPSVCVWCEAGARAANRFGAGVRAAARCHSAVRKARLASVDSFTGYYGAFANTRDSWREARRGGLAMTDTLVVDTTGVHLNKLDTTEEEPKSQPRPAQPPSLTKKPEPAKPAQRPEVDLIKHPLPSDVVTLSDDEEQPLPKISVRSPSSINPPLSISPLNIPDPIQQLIVQDGDQKFVLHPVQLLHHPNGSIIVPMSVPAMNQLPGNQMPAPPLAGMPAPGGYYQEEGLEPRGVPAPLTNVMNYSLDSPDPSENLGEDILQILRKKVDSMCRKRKSDSDSVSDCVGDGVSDMQCDKQPVRKDVKIDWEDKIPMDVISFLDPPRNRPNSRNNKNHRSTLGVGLESPPALTAESPFGVIAAVRSETTDVIDLC